VGAMGIGVMFASSVRRELGESRRDESARLLDGESRVIFAVAETNLRGLLNPRTAPWAD
jgi:hypothetical protein